ncbi:protein ALTERED XYLOGLUCAN 4-like [Abrus precatorius]|uniref:Protein ALTERED XYLOGLUCAN 4-like n=1 Tax=Abrus precatorius TaxID=3816 RepID=A0A8B8M6R1_ABRPR|nr:protein ALTERED XYLOGLUCAN 4-like [Abrus precatorius]
MRVTNPFEDQSLPKRLLPCTLNVFIPIALLPIALICLYFYPLSLTPSPATQLPYSTSLSASNSTHLPSFADKDSNANDHSCDYFNGKWISDKRGPLYNGSTCGMIKEGQNCIINGRLDSGYLYWRWKPSHCHLPRFEPNTFLQLIKNKHVAFIGDSLARNQIESLLCLLATVSMPKRVHHKGSNKWHFASHNASLSFYWSPFLVQGVQRQSKSKGPHYNIMHLDHVHEKWARDMDQIDIIVLSFGNWLLIPSVYYEDDQVLGCLNCQGLNYTEIGFYGPLRKALRTTLNSIIERKVAKGKGVYVIVRTFSPSHFKGDWDAGGTCSKTKPYRQREMEIGEVDAEIRKIEIEEVKRAKAKGNKFEGFRLEALDVTKLAFLRPDGHPGAYMKPFPFVNGLPKHVQNDCVHWCLPGPIDSWNEIFLKIIQKWEEQSRSEG